MSKVFAEVVTIGDEILYGQITDTNSQWMSAELDKIGIKTIRKSAIGDTKEAITEILREASKRAQVVLVTGGLGPTKDDITKKTIAEFTKDHLIINDHALEFVGNFFKERGREFTEINKQQALIPSKATYIHNAVGTAPGMWFNHEGTIIVCMPGVPHEMKWLMTNAILPKLVSEFELDHYVHRVIRTVGIGESFLAEKIMDWEDQLPEHIGLAYLPSQAQVKLRLTAVGANSEELHKDIEVEVQKLLPLIKKYVYSTNNLPFEAAIGELLKTENATLSTAESCTGGFIAHLITSVAGSSSYFIGSVVAYDNRIKNSVLGVKKSTLKNYGAVSEETIIQMAEGVRANLGTTYGIATSGIAGPGGGTKEKPVGTLWIACAGPNGTVAQKVLMLKERKQNIEFGAIAALNLLRLTILKNRE